MRPEIRHIDAAAEFHTSERCYINELSNCANDPGTSIARARVAAGVTTRWHRLAGTIERYVILSGSARVEIAGLPAQIVDAGDVVLIPADCPQRITCISEDDLVFLAICTPRFEQRAYEDIDGAPLEPQPE